MARILFGWELGLGLGHVAPHVGMLEYLHNAGHEVVFAARKPERAQSLLNESEIKVVQAPIIPRPASNNGVAYTYADVLLNIGWIEPDALAGAIQAWHRLFEEHAPDLFLVNYCPTGLLASLTWPMKRVIIDHGFTIPPSVSPLPNLRFWEKVDEAELLQREHALLDIMNAIATDYELEPFKYVAELFGRVDNTLLLGYPELDCYRRSKGTRYWGSALPSAGVSPKWPDVEGKRVFAYLRNFNTLPSLMQTLQASGHAVLVYAPSVDADELAKYASDTIKIFDKPLNIDEISSQCDLAITHAGYNLSVDLLLAGCPILLLPLSLESFLIARGIERLGAGLAAPMLKPQGMANKLYRLVNEPSFSDAAGRFSEKYAEFDRTNQAQNLANALELVIS